MAETIYEKGQRFQERLLTGIRAAMRAGDGAKHYAGELGISHHALLNKTDPDNMSDALTVEQLARLLVAVPDAGPALRPALEVIGGIYISPPPATRVGADLHRLMTDASCEFGDIAAALLDATDPDSPGGERWTDTEIDNLERQADEARGKIAALVIAARARRAAPAGAAEGNVTPLSRRQRK